MLFNVDAYILWLALFIAFTVLELLTVQFVSIWFALSALIVVPVSYFLNNFTIELLIFAVLSFLFLIFTKPILQKYFRGKEVFSSASIGELVEVVEVEEKGYKVKFKGVIWSAFTLTNTKPQVGDRVKIKGYKGSKIEI